MNAHFNPLLPRWNEDIRQDTKAKSRSMQKLKSSKKHIGEFLFVPARCIQKEMYENVFMYCFWTKIVFDLLNDPERLQFSKGKRKLWPRTCMVTEPLIAQENKSKEPKQAWNDLKWAINININILQKFYPVKQSMIINKPFKATN